MKVILEVSEKAIKKAKDAYLMARIAEELKDRSLTVESIVDKYCNVATPELRQKLIDRLNQMRQSGQVPEKV